MKKYLVLRNAFTMLELIFVIIILGIVSSIGAEIIAKTYEGYIIQRAQHRASIKTELVATQIANRLAYAIPGTVVRRSNLTTASEDINVNTLTDHNILQWVGADADSFNAVSSAAADTTAAATPPLPGWSGFCDVDASTTASISTPGSNLTLTTTIRTNLGLTAANPQIYFPAKSGLVSAPVTLPLANPIGLSASTVKIVEHYKLATSSYALVADGDLTLYYNFTPQRGVAIPTTTKELLLRNVSTFEFRGDGRTIRFKLCVDEDIGETKADGTPDPITICKEKAVF